MGFLVGFCTTPMHCGPDLNTEVVFMDKTWHLQPEGDTLPVNLEYMYVALGGMIRLKIFFT